MKYLYKLTHKRIVELGDANQKVYDTNLLGFFSSKRKCEEILSLYLKQPGFREYPDNFIIEQIEADIDDYNNIPNEFGRNVYFLSHEWYDGEYDYVSRFGFYSNNELAEKAKNKYLKEAKFIDHQDGFCIDEYEVDQAHWTEGFFIT